ncbi:DMT family transporter [Poseidonibacter lekithochrous]|uniref:DMT family transporter n=1 Tax=Poseidonibacter lekithochrous TaxID=1904463 RepID=UPI0008FC42A0|nr:DMT family transporter [Poseidonibacter lekithochrous]QKJ21776.1 EamA/RhaT family transporter [Poseidonibacter lekithochrous]
MQNHVKNQRLSYINALIAVFLWSTVASVFKISLQTLSVAQLVFYAVLTSTIVLLIIVLIKKLSNEVIEHFRNNYKLIIILGVLNPFLEYILLFKAYDLLPVQEAQTINFTWALMLTYLSIPLLGHKPKLSDLLAGLVCYFGVLVIATKGNPLSLDFSNLYGVFLALLTTVVWSLYWIYNTKINVNPVVGLFSNFLVAMPLVFVYYIYMEDFVMPDLKGLRGAVYIGLFEMSITFMFWLNAMKLTQSTSKIANLIFIAPFLSLIFIYFLVGEKILLATIVGLVLIVIGLLIQQSHLIKKKIKN